jgi:hypothetical protein
MTNTAGLARIVRHSAQKDVIHVVVGADQADEIFAFLHDKAGIAATPGGFLFVGRLTRATAFTLPTEVGQP